MPQRGGPQLRKYAVLASKGGTGCMSFLTNHAVSLLGVFGGGREDWISNVAPLLLGTP